MAAISEFHLQRAFTIFFQGEKWEQGPLKGQWKVIPASRPDVVSWHTPNGGTRDVREGVNLKATGVVAGIPDYFFLRSGALLGLEFKRPGGQQPPEKQLSTAQIAMHPRLRAAGIVALETVDNLEAAKGFVRRHGLVQPGL